MSNQDIDLLQCFSSKSGPVPGVLLQIPEIWLQHPVKQHSTDIGSKAACRHLISALGAA